MTDRNEISWVSWCNLDDLQLLPGDIGKAIDAFSRKTGMEARVIRLNPKNEKLAGEASNGIRVDYSAGVLLWEVWVSANPPADFVAPLPVMQQEKGCNKNGTQLMLPLGRPEADLDVQRALELKNKGLGARRIAKELGVSHMTISRALRNARQGTGAV